MKYSKKILFFLLPLLSQALLQGQFPTLLYHEPVPLYSPRGVDAVPALKAQFEKEHRWFAWDISFFSEQAKSARNPQGKRVIVSDAFGELKSIGDRIGRINPCGFFFETKLNFMDGADQRTLDLAAIPTTLPTPGNDVNYDAALKLFPALVEAYTTIRAETTKLTDPDEFQMNFYDDSANTYGFMTTIGSFKKRGFRTTFVFEPMEYLRFKLHLGCQEYAYKGDFFSLSAPGDGVQQLTDYLANAQSLATVASYFGYEMSAKKKTTIEDVLLSAEAKYPIILKGADTEEAVAIHPFFGMGVWFPTGAKSNPSEFFSLATGNEGFLGFGINGGMIIHFLDMLYASIKGSCTFFETKNVIMRYPTHLYQQGLYPFTKWFSKKPGMSWQLDGSLAVRHVIEGLSFYLDYVYMQHERDKISEYIPQTDYTSPTDVKELTPDSYLTAYELLSDGLNIDQIAEILGDDSFFKSELFTVGMSYEVTPGFELGLAYRGTLSGRQNTHTQTIMGTIRFAF